MLKAEAIPGKSRLLAPVRPSAAVRIAYEKRLHALIRKMNTSLLYWITAAYRKNTPLMAEDDAAPSNRINRVLRRLSKRWQSEFDALAPKLADYFAAAVVDRHDSTLKASLRDHGFSVKMQMTPFVRDVHEATIAENVGLIKSIAAQSLTQVQGMVMRSVAKGGDLQQLTQDLTAQFGVTQRRATFIARDQNNKATSVIIEARRKEIGVTQAQWYHSGGGHEPRPSHVQAGRARLIYDCAKGAFLDGKWVFPGSEINCKCFSRGIIPGLE